MSAYLFTIENYHAIKEAKIRVEGLTVLAGLNGSGKSTIARWFYRIVKILNSYEQLVNNKIREEYRRLSYGVERVAYLSPAIRVAWNQIVRANGMPLELEEMPEYITGMVDRLGTLLMEKLDAKAWRDNYQRICSSYGLEAIPDESIEEFQRRLSEKIAVQLDDIEARLHDYQTNHTIRNLNEIMAEEIDGDVDDLNINISLKEDGMELLDKESFFQPLNLRHSLYVETHRLNDSLESFSGSEIGTYLYNAIGERSKYGSAIATSVRKIIGGKVVLSPVDEQFPGDDVLRFVREDGLNILLRGAATGIISFSHLLRLLENGWINRDSVLIIDEPEAHLHPQWVVEYARILVMINKHLGAKVLISTHSPDMVAAIRSISEGQGVLDNTLFYLSTPCDGNKYCYEDLGHDIGPIFDSFNIAAERIDQYGI